MSPTDQPSVSLGAVASRPAPTRHSRLTGDGLRFRGDSFRLAVFEDCGFKSARFEQVAFRHVVFRNCYFRAAYFDQCKFIGCRFYDCSFHSASFRNCQLDYSEFYNCDIAFSQVRHALPIEPNLRLYSARNLRMNAQNRGASSDARLLLLEELKSTRRHNFRKAFYWRGYYRKYGAGERAVGLARWLLLVSSGALWGHGEKPARVLTWAVGVAAASALTLALLPAPISPPRNPTSWVDFLGYSVASLITGTWGAWEASTTAGRITTVIDGVIGLVLFGFFIASLY